MSVAEGRESQHRPSGERRPPGLRPLDPGNDLVFVKRRVGAPAGFFRYEAAGLHWLGDVTAGVDVVAPLEVTDSHLVVPRIPEVTPTVAAARELGARLATTHAAGAPAFGSPPGDWSGDGFIGPLVLPLREGFRWGPWYAEHRLFPYLRTAYDQGSVSRSESTAVSAVLDLLAAEDSIVGPPEPPARLHGDLWNGNVLWTERGVVLIDPAAHGGHRESDLAVLALFHLPHLEAVLAAYDEAAPLADGWRERVGLHQLHHLLVHAVLFGGSYGAQAGRVARRYR